MQFVALLVWHCSRRQLSILTSKRKGLHCWRKNLQLNRENPSMRLVDYEGVECEKAACAVRTSRNCHEDDDALRVRCLQSQFAMLHFSSLTFGIQWSFFFWKPCRSNLGPSRDSGWKAKNWGPFEGCTDSDNLVTMEVFGNVSTKRLRCRMISKWPGTFEDSSTDNKAKPGQRCKFRLVCDCVCTVTRVSIQMQKRAKVLKIHSQKTDYVFLVNARPFPEQSSSIATSRVGSI